MRYLVCENFKSISENIFPTREIAWDLKHISHKIATNISCPTASDLQVSMALYSIYWIIYKFSILENQKNDLASSSKYKNGNFRLMVSYLMSKFESNSSKSQVVVETRSRSSSKRKSNHDEEDPNFIPVNYGIVKFFLPKKTGALDPTSLELTTNELWTWSCSSTSMIITSFNFDIHLHNSDLIKLQPSY